jgi:excisionase family DNA binding protein
MVPKSIRERVLTKKRRLDSYRPLSPELVENLRQSLTVEYTHSSNAIEGNTLTLGETRMVIEEGATIGGKTVREHLEALNHPKAVAYLEELAGRERRVTREDVLRLHLLVMDGVSPTAGRYRESGVRISGSTFSPPPSRDVPSMVDKLLDWIAENPNEHPPIELAALSMHRFSQVHPFTDGNGRVGRLLMNLTLIKASYPLITNISYRDRSRYLQSLQEADEGNPNPLVRLISLSTESSLDAYLRAVEEPRTYTLPEASKRTGIGANYLTLLARKGTISAYRNGGRWLISEADLEAYINNVRRAGKSSN